MVDRLAETKYWVNQIANRVTATPGEQLNVAEAAMTAAIMIAIDTLLDVRGQSDDADDDEITRLVMFHFIPTIKALIATALDAQIGSVDIDPEILGKHYGEEI